MNRTENPKAPWHLWAVGILTLLFNLGGVVDYLGTHMFPESYLAAFGKEAVEYILGFPVWFVGFWAIGVWFAFLSSILILARSRFAVHAVIAALVGLLVVTVWQYTHPMPASMNSPEVHLFNLAIWIVQLFVLWYALRMKQAGVLR